MKFRVTFKTPDAAEEAFKQAEQYAGEIMPLEEIDEKVVQPMEAVINRFLKYHELITIEFDTETQTAVVVPLREKPS